MEEATAAMKTIMPPFLARSLARCTASPSHTIPSKLRHGHQHTQSPPSLRPKSRSHLSLHFCSKTSCKYCKLNIEWTPRLMCLKICANRDRELHLHSPFSWEPSPFEFCPKMLLAVIPLFRRSLLLLLPRKWLNACADAALLNNSEFKVGRLDAIVRLDLK